MRQGCGQQTLEEAKEKPRGGNGASHGSLEGTFFYGWGKDPSDKPSYALAPFADQLQKSNLRARFAAQFAAQLSTLRLLVSCPAAHGGIRGNGGSLALGRGFFCFQGRPNNSGSFATFTAMRRASSKVSIAVRLVLVLGRASPKACRA
jgi:hypothetical protein